MPTNHDETLHERYEREAREWETAGLHERLRLLEEDHKPEGWPAVQMRDITALLDERDTLREALRECLRVNETSAGDNISEWANAMLKAREALGEIQDGETNG